MGKKSKNKAKARPVGGGKPPRCARCACLVRSNGTSCPGCARAFCGRCEARTFGGCPEGEDCVSPMRRCEDCVSGKLVAHKLDVANGKADVNSIATKLAPEAQPFINCPMDGCPNSACAPCFFAHTPTEEAPPFVTCSVCIKFMCWTCYDALEADALEAAVEAEEEAAWFAYMYKCVKCFRSYCSDCAEPSSYWWFPREHDGEPFCAPCFSSYQYWWDKSCTNPDCPNEAGMVETKRCGDCRVARYCSKECQNITRPTHKDECIKMKKEKRERRVAAREIRNCFFYPVFGRPHIDVPDFLSGVELSRATDEGAMMHLDRASRCVNKISKMGDSIEKTIEYNDNVATPRAKNEVERLEHELLLARRKVEVCDDIEKTIEYNDHVSTTKAKSEVERLEHELALAREKVEDCELAAMKLKFRKADNVAANGKASSALDELREEVESRIRARQGN